MNLEEIYNEAFNDELEKIALTEEKILGTIAKLYKEYAKKNPLDGFSKIRAKILSDNSKLAKGVRVIRGSNNHIALQEMIRGAQSFKRNN